MEQGDRRMGFFGWLLVGFLSVGASLASVGLVMSHRARKRGEAEPSSNVTENVADVNDRFNRARYMSKDGK